MTRPSSNRSILVRSACAATALVLLTLGAAAAPAALIVNVVASPTNVPIGQPVAFSATVTGGVSPFLYTWNFADGGSASGALTVHTFASAGPFNVKCTVRDSSQPAQIATGSVTVRVSKPPDPIDFQVKDTATGALLSYSEATGWRAVVGENLTFVPVPAVSTPLWSFGDGSNSFESQPVHAFEKAGSYTVTLTGSGQTKSALVLVETQAGPPLTGAFTYRYVDGGTVDRNAVVAGRSVRFSASDPADTYLWSFGDGGAAGAREVDHAFGVPGLYTTSLAVTRGGSPSAASSVTFVVVGPGVVTDTWVLPGVAFSDGLNGALWQSDVTLFNPSPTQPMTVSLAFADARQPLADPSQLVYFPIVVDRQRSVRFVNVLTGYPFYASKGSYGALFLRVANADQSPVVTARTYNTGDGSGTYGLAVPSLPVTSGISASSPRAARTLLGLKENASAYTNLAVVNLGGDPAVADVALLDPAGSPLGVPVRFALGPYGVAQVGRILAAAGVTASADTFVAVVTLVSGTSVVPYASVIDVLSKDPIVVNPVSTPASSYRLPGIVRTRGQGSTFFRSDFYLHNPSTQIRKLNVSYSYRSGDGPRFVASNVLILQPLQTIELDDFVKEWLKLPPSDTASYVDAFVDVTPAAGDPAGEAVLVLGKTYNSQPTGSTGLQVPGYTAADAASAAGPARRLLMTGLQSTAAYRTNLAFFLAYPGATGSVSAMLRLYDGSGALVRSLPITLDDFTSFVQKGDSELFGGLSGDRTRITAVLEDPTGSAPVAAYATVLDQVSGDAVLVVGKPQP